MHPIVLILSLLLFGAFGCYIVGRIARVLGGEKASGTASGIVAAAVTLVALWAILSMRADVAAGQAITATLGTAGLPISVVLRADSLSVLISGIVLALGLIAMVYSIGYMAHDTGVDKFFSVLLLMVGSMVGLTFATDVFNLFILFELMSVSSFILVSFRKSSWEPIEAGFKYIIISVVGSFLALLGIVLMFMYTGQFSLEGIASGLAAVAEGPKLLMLGLVIAGFGVKTAIVPLHTWLPDAHSAAPSGISAMLSGVVIQTGFFVLLRVGLGAMPDLHATLGLALALFGVLTMTVGNLTAIQQTDLKRMLAYSSVAQMGYILLGVGLGLQFSMTLGVQGGLFHIMTHAFMKGLAFMCAGALIHVVGTREIAKMRGIGWQMPVTVSFFGLAAMGLAGVPPLSGFMSKLFIYEAGFKAANVFGYILAGIAIINSVVSLAYYLPALSTMFARGEGGQPKIKEAPLTILIPLGILACLTLILGIWPELGLRYVYPAAKLLLNG